MKLTHTLLIIFCSANIYSQINCEAFLYYYKDTLRYDACKKTEEAAKHYQFSKEFHELLDEAIEIDPGFAYSYGRKSTAYLKSGDFVTWKKLVDKTVELNPKDLYYVEARGNNRYKCFRDYAGALEDFRILDSLGAQTDHLVIQKALCHKSLGRPEKAIEIIESYQHQGDDIFGLTGYIHLGVLYLEQKDYKKAEQIFLKQIEINDIAENQFYLALTYSGLHRYSECIAHLKKAKALYLSEHRMYDSYIDPIDKIYLEDIENELVRCVGFEN